MADYDLPSPTEKLPYKFILDSLKKKDPLNEELVETQGEEHEGIEIEPQEESFELQGVAEETPLEANAAEPPMEEQLEEMEQLEAEEAPPELAGKPIDPPPDKRYFRIGETADLIGVEPHVLRYWEGEFPDIRPMKSRSGHRVYSRKDVEIFTLVRKLLYVDNYSIKGAKKKLKESKKKSEPHVALLSQHREQLKSIQQEIKALIQIAKTPL